MRLIAKGWQYRVYHLGNGRVLKRERRALDQFARVFLGRCREGRISLSGALEETRRIERMGRDAIAGLKECLDRIDVDLFGNPVFRDGIDYEQDEVSILQDSLRTSSAAETRRTLEQYAELILYMWGHGFSDTAFNFEINNGINARGVLVQVDLGELTFVREKVESHVSEKRWLRSPSYLSLGDESVKSAYAALMDARLSRENLDRRWRRQR